ncbi:MAG: LPS-assembly protein LptD [Sulfurovum sp.]
MLKHTLSSLLLASTILHANVKKDINQEFQILANNIDTKTNTITATGEVVAYSTDYYLVADKIIYHKENNEIELFDNVMIVKNNTLQTQSNYAKLNIKTNDIYQNPTVLFDKSTNIWLNSNITNKKENVVDLDATTISSCNCLAPFWSIKSSSADYDTQDKWLNTYNTRLYIKDVPILYTPYLGFSTDNTRRTGLLFPSVGYSSDEGTFYSQPLFIAPADNYDIELVPQYRSFRGAGIYAYYRLKDSPYSFLNFKTGIFKERSNYTDENDLGDKNKHFGWNLNYYRTNLFSKNDDQDGLYLDINSLNNVEYITLEENEGTVSTDQKVESKLNYFYNTNSYYYGLYSKYYIDTSAATNDSTLQELPQLQLHKYSKESFIDDLTYNFDFQFKNYERDEDINATIYDFSVPLIYSKNILNDYMYFSIKNNTVFSKYVYDNSSLDHENGSLIQNDTTIGIGSNLIKPYEKFLHTVSLDGTYTYPKLVHKKGDLYKVTSNESELSPFPVTQTDKNITVKFDQSLFDKDDLREIINHSMTQTVIFDSFDEAKLDNLINYTKISFINGYI